MFDFSKSYAFSEELANSGVRMVVGPDEENDWVLLCRMPNLAYKNELSTVMMANRRVLELLKSQDPVAHAKRDSEIYCEVLAKTVLIDWGSGFTDAGAKLPYSVINAKSILVKYPDFRSDIIDFASDKRNYPVEGSDIDVEQIKKK